MDDLWWAFVAGIDRAALIQEVPGSVSDRRMRAEHAKHAAAVNASRLPAVVVTSAALRREDALLGPGRLAAAEREARGWTARAAKTRRQQIAAYAAQRGTAA